MTETAQEYPTEATAAATAAAVAAATAAASIDAARPASAVVGTPAAPPMWDWRLSQVFGGDKMPDEEIPEGL